MGPKNKPLDVVGIFQANVISTELTSVEEFYVVRDLSQSLLCYPTVETLNVLLAINSIKETFLTVFSGVGKMNDQRQTKLKPNAKEFSMATPGTFIFCCKKAVIAEIKNTEANKAVTRVTQPTQGCSGRVPLPKQNAKVRICVNYTKLKVYVANYICSLQSMKVWLR